MIEAASIPNAACTDNWITNSYVNRLRTSLSLQQPVSRWTNGFGYDITRRLTNVISQAGAFGYTHAGQTVSAGSLIQRISLPNGSNITNAYDGNARLLGTYLKTSSHTTLDKHEYLYNAGHQRIRARRTDGSYYTNTYDSIGQLSVAISTVSSENRAYLYDAAWNLTARYAPTYQAFGADVKNQLTTGPTSPYGYDANGNLTNYSTYFHYEYDAENRLSAWEYAGTSRIELRYDGLGRLRDVTEYVPGGTQWTWQSQKVYIYDGMRVIQERSVYAWDYANATPTVSYTRGSDLSGSLEGAGGIGGLLARSHGYSSGSWSTHNFYHADGNGNITYLVNSSQTVAASYRYDAYGNALAASGSLWTANVYRFSSKEVHDSYGLYYYGYRWYSPYFQRWINRDPLGSPMVGPSSTGVFDNEFFPFEFTDGGNLFHYVQNSPIHSVDSNGLDIWILKDKCGKWGLHEIVVGSNGDGTYWQTDMNPARGGVRVPFLGWPINCPADIRFYPNSTIDPNNLAECYEVKKRLKTSPTVDKKTKTEAERRQNESEKKRWDLCGNNCADYTESIANFAAGTEWRERLENKRQ